MEKIKSLRRSKSLNSSEDLKVRDKTEIEKEVDELGSKMEALGQLTSSLADAIDRTSKNKSIDGDSLDLAVGKVVEKYLLQAKNEPEQAKVDTSIPNKGVGHSLEIDQNVENEEVNMVSSVEQVEEVHLGNIGRIDIAIEQAMEKYFQNLEDKPDRVYTMKAKEGGSSLENKIGIVGRAEQGTGATVKQDSLMGLKQYVDLLGSQGKKAKIAPPNNLSDKPVNMRNMQGLSKTFESTPIFTNSPGYTVRELLESLNGTVSKVPHPGISREELVLVLDTKLHPRIKGCLPSYHSDSLEETYANLLSMFSLEKDKRQAFSSIASNKIAYKSLKEFTDDTMYTLSLVQEPDRYKSTLLIHALQSFLPPRLGEKINEYVDLFESANNMEPPPVGKLFDRIMVWRAEIDAFLSKNKGDMEKKRYNVVHVDEPHVDQVETQKPCTHCGRSNHSSNNCAKKMYCEACMMMGHSFKFCRNPKREVCAKCLKGGHSENRCRSKILCRLCNSPSHETVVCPVYLGEEPCRGACSKCEEKMHIRLFHPESKCRNFPKN